MRKLVFGTSVAIVGCVGIWILLTAAFGGRESSRVLNAVSPVAGQPPCYAVKLWEFEASERATADDMISMEKMQTLAGGHDYWIAELSGGRLALCVGRFEDRDSEQLAELLRGVQQFQSPSGNRLFQSAACWRYPE